MTRSFVADASVPIAWVHPAQATSETEAMLDRLIAGDSLVVPALWPIEVANALTILRRRRKLTADEARNAIGIVCDRSRLANRSEDAPLVKLHEPIVVLVSIGVQSGMSIQKFPQTPRGIVEHLP